MTSQLWQRLKAARKFADLTQTQVATACGVTRSAYAFWESADEATRTRPSAEQVMSVAKLARVPIEWLMNDAANVDDVWRLGSLSTPKVNGTPVPLRQVPMDRATETFWRAVEYHVACAAPERQDAFGYEVMPAPLGLVADFCFKRHLVNFCAVNSGHCVREELGRILTLERALHRPLNKAILVWSHGQNVDLESLPEMLDSAFGVKIVTVSNAEEAAAFLLSLN